MSVVVTHATPAPGKAKRRADAKATKGWPERIRLIRTCSHCGTVYVTAGDAYACEHYHEGLS